jgi:biotin carboxyl carrier protein
VSAMQTVLDDAAAPDTLPVEVSQLLVELTPLLDQALTASEFFAEYLQRVVGVLGGVSATLWTRTPHDNFQQDYQLNHAVVALDQVPNGRECHAEILRRVAKAKRPVCLPPHKGELGENGAPAAINLARYAVVLAPIVVDNEVAGIVEVWQEPGRTAASRQQTTRALAMLASLAGAYLHKAQWRQLQDGQQAWGQIEAFARQIHDSLDPREVAYLVANEGRRLTSSDQVSVALNTGIAVEVEAISGANAVEKRSRVVQSMRELCARVLSWGERLTYDGARDESWPPAVRKALDDYLAASNSRLLVVLPLGDPRGKHDQAPSRVALLAESYQASPNREMLESKLQVVSLHAASALYNALAYRQASTRFFVGWAARLRQWTRGKSSRKAALAGAALAALVLTLTFIPAELRLEARGQLLPKERQVVYATLHGKVVEMKSQHGDRVEKNQELLFVEDLDSQLKIEQLGLKASFAEQRLAMLGEQIAKAATAEDRNSFIKERINLEYDLRKAVVERDILLQGSLSPRKAAVRSPLAGKVVTFDTREQLVGKTVKPGDPLVRIARVDGPWEIELLIPESRIAALRDGLHRAPAGELPVDLLLASHPLRTFQGKLRRDGLGGETTIKDNAVVLPVRVQIADAELASLLSSMPVGLEVRAKVDCGQRALGQVWFGDLLEFFYEHLWF